MLTLNYFIIFEIKSLLSRIVRVHMFFRMLNKRKKSTSNRFQISGRAVGAAGSDAETIRKKIMLQEMMKGKIIKYIMTLNR